MLATIASATISGSTDDVTVEVHVSTGLPGFTIVGLPDASCREARDRVRAAVLSSGLRSPAAGHGEPGPDRRPQVREPVSTWPSPSACWWPPSRSRPERSPARSGSSASSGSTAPSGPWPARCPMVDALDDRRGGGAAGQCGRGRAGRSPPGARGPTLDECWSSLCGDEPWPPLPSPAGLPPHPAARPGRRSGPDLARRALEMAAAGGHHLLMVGPPGAGKTMLAQRLPGLLPASTRADALEATRIHSAAGRGIAPGGLIRDRRSGPPTTAPRWWPWSAAAAAGLRPGEISLAPAACCSSTSWASSRRRARRPAPAARGGRSGWPGPGASVTLPARFLLVAAMNPCPCGERARPALSVHRRRPGPLRPAPVRARCSTGSTCGWWSTARSRRSAGLPPGRAQRRGGRAGRRGQRRAAAGGVRSNAELTAAALDETPPAPRAAPPGRAAPRPRPPQRPRGATAAAVALTIADLAGEVPRSRADEVAEANCCGPNRPASHRLAVR